MAADDGGGAGLWRRSRAGRALERQGGALRGERAGNAFAELSLLPRFHASAIGAEWSSTTPAGDGETGRGR